MGELTSRQLCVERPIYVLNKETGETVDVSSSIEPIYGDSAGKHFLYMEQLSPEDIHRYLQEAEAAESLLEDPTKGGINLLQFDVLKAVMRQPSTRTGGTLTTAMRKLGGNAELISGMHASSEAKGESLADSWVAFATQSDFLASRTKEEWGPAYAAHSIDTSFEYGKLTKRVPVINAGDGRWQHPTQAIGDLFTIQKRFDGQLDGLTIAIVGDHERYRAHHSLMLGAAAVGMNIIAVETPIAPIPDSIIEAVGPSLISRQEDLDGAMAEADILYIGRSPDEYTDDDKEERARAEALAKVYEGWTVDLRRIQQMETDSIVMHPRPRKGELLPDVDADPRMADVEQMANMIPVRMAIIALHAGKSIIEASQETNAEAA